MVDVGPITRLATPAGSRPPQAIEHQHRRARRFARRPDDDGTAGSQRWRHFAGIRTAGKFHAVNAATTPTGSCDTSSCRPAPGSRSSGLDAARFLGVPAELVDRERPLAARLGERLAGLERDALGSLVDP